MENVLALLQENWYWCVAVIACLIIILKFIPRYKIAPPACFGETIRSATQTELYPPRSSDTGS